MGEGKPTAKGSWTSRGTRELEVVYFLCPVLLKGQESKVVISLDNLETGDLIKSGLGYWKKGLIVTVIGETVKPFTAVGTQQMCLRKSTMVK